jgi:hypothetical protein
MSMAGRVARAGGDAAGGAGGRHRLQISARRSGSRGGACGGGQEEGARAMVRWRSWAAWYTGGGGGGGGKAFRALRVCVKEREGRWTST